MTVMKCIYCCKTLIYNIHNDLQKVHDKYIKKLDELIEAKNKEIMTV